MNNWLVHNTNWVTKTVKKSGLADWTDQVDCSGFTLLEWGIEWTAAGAPAGDFTVDGKVDVNATRWLPIPITVGFYGAWPTVAGVADAAGIVIKNPMPLMRLTWTHTGGGAANQFDVFTHRRSG